ncbi:hypothetical protein H4R34_004431 [Dimargaris verticillata]|uniref:Extracellular membrane protein CFEM domain-containing protein n=1 Tax=Dimargaris verticillata TaxID=2761393 RepID=A0A9W8B473_9FUNG|nr:hypothetical protein H4R34_004431 [Dimargaris verticillata]
MQLSIATLFAALSANAVMAQANSDISGLSSMTGYSEKELECLSDSKCVNDPQACLSCLGISSDDIEAAVDCMLECPQPTSLNNMGPYMECANKCSSSMVNKAGPKSSSDKPTSSADDDDDEEESSSASGKDSATASKSSSSTNGNSDSNDGSEDFLDDGSGAGAAAMSMALVAALPVAVLAAL